VEARPEITPAYYVQDYEPLFAPHGSGRSDRALLSYNAIAGQVLFAKTHWLCNVVSALHGIPIVKVAPSLDREVFNAEARARTDGVVRIAAMVRPRTPRRRPAATLEILARIVDELGARVQAFTFGCDESAHSQLGRSHAGVEHLGLLTRSQVADLMRRCDIFIDASAYQAFGRSGLEGMACGAVPVLPAFGGVHEYAQHDRNSLVLEDDRAAAIAESVLSLARDSDRLKRLRETGLQSAARFSIEHAAQSQLEVFSTALRRRTGAAGVLA
jgi:glycosyltransferase involved in cell wall biosynthesis